MIRRGKREWRIYNKNKVNHKHTPVLASAAVVVVDCCARMQNVNSYLDVNKNCDRYQEITTFLQDHAHLFEWQPEEAVLDAGCGPGDITATVLQRWLPADFRVLVGVDVSQIMIKHAKRKYTGTKLAFYTADIASESDVSNLLSNENYSGGFNKVFSFCVLHWLNDLERGVRNVHSLLRPRGQALLTFPVDRYFQRTFQTVRKRRQWSDYLKLVDRQLPPFPRTSDPSQEFRNMMKSVGFAVVQCDVQDRHSDYGSVEGIKGLIESLDEDCHCIPTKLKEQYLDACLQIMYEMGAVNIENASVKQTMLTCVVQRL